MADELKEAFQQLIVMNDNFLRLQRDFVISINELSNRLNMMEIRDEQVEKQIDEVVDVSNDIYRRMEVHPNEVIIKELDDLKEVVCTVINSYKLDRKDDIQKTQIMLDQVSELVKKRRWVDRIIWILITLLTLASGIFTVWENRQKESHVKNYKSQQSEVIKQEK